jgi:two-component system NarL family sensor kinase
MAWFTRLSVTTKSSRAALRRRAAARERARIGRELHDGIMQRLISVDMQIETALRAFGGDTRALVTAIQTVQAHLREEMAALRGLIDSSRTNDVGPAELAATIDGIVWKFNRSSGLAAACFMPPEEDLARLPRRVCSEIVRIVREALTNVQRHSAAGNVVVELRCEADQFTLTITDDGRGINGVRRPPLVLSERVAAIGSRVTLAAVPRGTRVVVAIPREGPWKHTASSVSFWPMIILSFVMG